jgi:hypothetical protein
VRELRNSTAERFKKACEQGHFNKDIWRGSDITPETADWSHDVIYLLSYGNVIGDGLQRLILTGEWESGGWGGWVKPSESIPPEDPKFHFWLILVEKLKYFPLFGEFIADKAAPYLYSVCERIINDTKNQMTVCINNYHYHHGQYSDSRNTARKKKNDLLLQIIRVLNKCYID